jgi:hypothetical protein
MAGKKFISYPEKDRTVEDGFIVSSLTFITNFRNCVAVKRIGKGGVQVRNTKDKSKTTLTFNKAEWKAFIGGVKGGEFDL